MSLIKLAYCQDCEKLKEAIQWMTGSADFGPGGKARVGYLKGVKPLLKEPIIKKHTTTLKEVIEGGTH